MPEVAEEETPVAVDEPTPEEAHTVVAEPTLEAEAAPVIEDSEPVPVDEEVSGDVPTDTVPLAFEAGVYSVLYMGDLLIVHRTC